MGASEFEMSLNNAPDIIDMLCIGTESVLPMFILIKSMMTFDKSRLKTENLRQYG